MSDIAICVDGLGKQYRIGKAPSYGTFRDALSSLTRLPGRLLRSNGSANGADRFWALKDVSFEVKRGEVVGIIGRNGAGKSTLLKILSRITEPTEGGADIYGRVGSLLEVGTGFHPELTGRENIFLNGAILGMRRAEILKKFDEIVAFAEVEKFIDTPVKHFSSGMYMRLAFAVAAHLEPEILIVDEVLAVGDAEFQKKCLGKMGEVARGGRTVLFVSHNMGAIKGLCSTVIRLKDGQLADAGEPTTEIAAYLLDGAPESNRGARRLGADLELVRLEFDPPTITTGSATRLVVAVRASDDTVIDHIKVFLQSPFGVRAGIVDLRSEQGSYHLRRGRTLQLETEVHRLNLVAESYSVGLFVSCGGILNDFTDLATLNVFPGERRSSLSSYTAFSQGIMVIDYSPPNASFS